ncbi:MAG TPA: diguanylate cyclase, partial [Burkholderiales bacterium]|nr:diguanylate cyclase [Burkholderiales bacterium]
QRLEELTAGEVDTVADRDGRTFLLRHAQEQLRHSEAAKQAAILNALPAHIALLDTQGLIISVNETWRRFACADAIQGPGHRIGLNYLEICDSALGEGSSEAHQIAEGIRSVLAGRARSFSIEYPFHSPTEQRWFLMTATPLAGDHPNGAVVMHLNVTEKKRAEVRIRRQNRVYAVLSGINSAIVRIRSRDELFREVCRIAVEDGKFRMAWIGLAEPDLGKARLVSWMGADDGYLDEVGLALRNVALDQGAGGRALRERRPIVFNDVETDAQVVFRKEALARGYRSLAVLPLLVGENVVGVLALYAGEVGFFDENEMKLLHELAGDIAFALDHIEKAEKLDYLAYYDSLTGLANRSLFLERVAQYMRSAVSGGHKLALFLIDLERFNNINDSLGRPAGDALLRQVAEWLTRNVGDANLVARVGADHFAVVLPEVKQEGNVARLVEKAIEAFLEHPFRLNDAVFRIATKVGVALFPDDGANADTLFKNAEAALKKAKASGDRYLFYTQKMTEAVAGRLTLENQLRQALDKGEFVLHYQPKVNLVSGRLTGAEALIRWNDPR